MTSRINSTITTALFLSAMFAVDCRAATISITPGTSSLNLGDNLMLTVEGSGFSDLYAFQFDVGYDPSIISALSVTPGGLLGAAFVPGFIDNAAGMITFIADTSAGPGPGASGTGVLSNIAFVAIGVGSTPVAVSNLVLLDSSLAEIVSVGVASATVSVTDATVPEPAMFAQAAAGLALMGLMRRRRKR